MASRWRRAADLLAALRVQAAAAGATAATLEVTASSTLWELVQDAPVLGILMQRSVSDPPAEFPPGYGHRPMTSAEYDAWLERHVESYARDGLDRVGGDLPLARERSRADFARYLPDGLATPDHAIVVLTQDGAPVGSLWLAHHRDGGETFGFDFEIDEAFRGRGLGRAGIAVGERLAHAAGDTVLGLHVFGGNLVAQNLYRSVGFAEVDRHVDLLGAAG